MWINHKKFLTAGYSQWRNQRVDLHLAQTPDLVPRQKQPAYVTTWTAPLQTQPPKITSQGCPHLSISTATTKPKLPLWLDLAFCYLWSKPKCILHKRRDITLKINDHTVFFLNIHYKRVCVHKESSETWCLVVGWPQWTLLLPYCVACQRFVVNDRDVSAHGPGWPGF